MNKNNRLDESLSSTTFMKNLTGNISTSIDPSKIVVTPDGILQSTANDKQPNTNNKHKHSK
jgi:hypothetical protein